MLERRTTVCRRPSAVEKDGWKAGVSGVLSVADLGLLAFLYFQLKGQYTSLKFIEPAQVHGSIDDLVGMDDIKAEVAQIKDQYLRRAEYAEYGISKPFNVMFSGPAGTGKTKLASYLAKELHLPILFHSAANLDTASWPAARIHSAASWPLPSGASAASSSWTRRRTFS